MPIASPRNRRIAVVTCLAATALFSARAAHGAWGVDPVQVHATTASCPLVSASDDAAYGAIVVWQEITPSGGQLRAQHLLANGDVDAAWGGPVPVSNQFAARTALGSVSDGAGGAYVWWMQGAQLFLTRFTAEGAVATGWPAGGRAMGGLVDALSRPVVLADGSGGVYACWLTQGLTSTWVEIRAHHLGPANTGKDGWPTWGRNLANTAALEEHASGFGIAVAQDGGVWLAYGSTVSHEPDVYEPGAVRVTHLTAAGLPAAGWSETGVALATFRGDLLAMSPDYWGVAPPMRLAAVAPDGNAGAFILFADVQDAGMIVADYRLQRVGPDGTIAAGWPVGGMPASPFPGLTAWEGKAATLSLTLHADGSGGVYAGRPGFYDHFTELNFKHVSASGATLEYGPGGGITGLESSARGDGGVVVASYYPTGPYGPYQPSAYLQLSQSAPGGTFSEWHGEPVVEWYGDIGLAATGDGGSILAWSQVNERYGIFAIRMNPGSIVTGVPPTPAIAPSLRVRFVRGEGVRAAAAFPGAQHVSFALHDLAGRRVAAFDGDAATRDDVVLPGTRELPGGVYFARASDGTRELRAKVLVLR